MGIPVQEQCLVGHGYDILSNDSSLYMNTLVLYSPIHIKVQSLGNAPVDMILISPWPISHVKSEIKQHLNISTDRQLLVCNGCILENDKLVSDYVNIIQNRCNIIVQKKYAVTLQPSNATLSITDHHSVGDIKRLIQKQLNIPQNNQVLFIHNEFQENNHRTFSNPDSNVEAYVVDNRNKTRIIAIDLPNQTRHVCLLDDLPTDLNLKKMIERSNGYAIEAQNLVLQTNINGGNRIVNGVIMTLSITSHTLFWKLPASSDRSYGSSLMPSATIEQAISYIANELAILPYRVSLFTSVGHYELAEKQRTCSWYKLKAGQIIEAEVCEPVHRQVCIILPTGKILQIDLVVDISIHELKLLIQDQEDIDAQCQVIVKGSQELANDEIIYNCLANWYHPLNMKILLSGPLALDSTSLAPHFDFDFTDIVDTEEVFTRGNYPYERPCGCKRIALNVAGRYGYDDRWLGMTGADPEEWPVSYHGTGNHNAMSIVEEGFKLSKGDRFKFGKGIYSTPELEVAKLYANEFEHEGQKYRVLFQNRVNPRYLKVITKEETEIGTYWLSSKGPEDADDTMSELIRPYAVCIFKA
jgi:hypothetical protein